MQRSRFEALDSWRGVCALMVALYHLNAVSHFLEAPMVRHSWIFVDFFFVLSGFVITHAYGARLRSADELLSFAIRRFGRIWPLSFAMLVCFAGLEVAKAVLLHGGGMAVDRAPFSGATSPGGFASSLLLLQATPLWPHISPNGPSWSISAEYWTYLIFAVTVLLFPARTAGTPVRRGPLIVLAVVSVVALLLLTSTLDQIYAFAILRCVYGFSVGALTYVAWLRLRDARWGAASLIEIGYLLLAIPFVIYAVLTPAEFAAPLVFAAGVLVFAREGGAVSALLRTPPLRLLGTLSFSIYMTHGFLRELASRLFTVADKKLGTHLMQPVPPPLRPVLNATNLIDLGLWGGDALALAFLLITVAVSAATYRWLELPGQELFRRIASRVLSARERAAAPRNDPAPL